MFKLTIKRADGTTYWIERFNRRVDLDAWLADEQTRPYWDSDFTTEIEDITPPVDAAAEAARAAREARRNALTAKFKTLTPADVNNIAKIQPLFLELLEILGLKE